MIPNPIPQVFPRQLADELLGPSPPLLLDVREADEREISKLENDLHIPMSDIPERLGELDSSVDTVVYCRTGSRSARVVHYLMRCGFSQVRNLETGINGWAADVDPRLPQY